MYIYNYSKINFTCVELYRDKILWEVSIQSFIQQLQLSAGTFSFRKQFKII